MPADTGRLIWVTPHGARREIERGAFSPSDTACERCGESGTVTTRVREHRPCGQIGLDGMLGDGDRAFRCPKCETTDDDGFAVVATIETCTTCGHPLDRGVE